MFYGGGQNQTTIECLYMESPMEATKIKTTIEGASWRWPKLKPPISLKDSIVATLIKPIIEYYLWKWPYKKSLIK